MSNGELPEERDDQEESASLFWTGDEQGPVENGEAVLTLRTNRGAIDARYHPAKEATRGVIWVGGAGGGLNGPARGLYPAACESLQRHGVAGLRLHYRQPNVLEECVLDVLLGVEFLHREGVEHVGLVGHSFGGAVVISAGALSERVKAVVAMSTQTYGTALVGQLPPRPLLLIHGSADEILPDSCSQQVYRFAEEPKELVLYPGAGHGLDEVREEVLDLLERWLLEKV